MSLQAILNAILASGEDQIREIEARSDAQVSDILAQAELESQRLREEALVEAAAPASKERALILHKARLEALQVVGDAREELVAIALSRIKAHLAEMRSQPAYRATLRWLVEEAMIELGIREKAGDIGLVADPRDRELLEDILLDLQVDLPIRYDLDSWGGLIVETEDGRITAINTLDARLTRATPFFSRYLAGLLEDEAKHQACQAMTMAMPACGR